MTQKESPFTVIQKLLVEDLPLDLKIYKELRKLHNVKGALWSPWGKNTFKG